MCGILGLSLHLDMSMILRAYRSLEFREGRTLCGRESRKSLCHEAASIIVLMKIPAPNRERSFKFNVE
jgi:hypothetical protein